ncbi:protein GPR15LG [Marmota flaviventris]|uniref:protein GPR15LG n=1 Tax=Marmota flaviventris TaxID=93162 RepID=UPI000FFFA0A7|nr:protein GPR15L [Marmota flaviventris]
MRLLILSSLFCILLLCFSIFSSEGKRHPAKSWKLCCHRVPALNLTTQKASCPHASTHCSSPGNRMRLCRVCKLKPMSQSWVVPGALPQV